MLSELSDARTFVAVPSPGALVTFAQMEEAERNIAASLPDMHDIGVIEDTRDRLMAIEQYLRGKDMHLPAIGAQRRLEARIGQILGKPENHGPATVRHDERSVEHRADRSDFRILARALNGECDLTADEWRRSRRALVALIKERTKKAEVEVAEVVVSPSGARINVPDDMTAEELCRKGMAMEEGGMSPTEIVSEFKIAIHTYRKMRDIVLLADRSDLSRRDRDTAARALYTLNETEMIGQPYESVKPIAERLWGTEGKSGISRQRAEKNRIDKFENALGLLMHACATADKFDVPYLSTERVEEAIIQIDTATKHLASLKRRIMEVRG